VKPSTDNLRRALLAASAISLPIVIASCIGVAASFIQPTLDLLDLYRVASLTRTAGFCFLVGYLISGFAFLSAVPPRADMNMSGWWWRLLTIVCALCFLLILLSPHTYVYPSSGGWITKSKAGTFSVSSELAKEYLWRAVRMWSVIPLCGSLYVITFTSQFGRPTRTPIV
jgi:hypothetical protein